ncbi:MAG: hypothetical protein QXY45_01410 [Candidatus Aenigmatarchaeota archaeon]
MGIFGKLKLGKKKYDELSDIEDLSKELSPAPPPQPQKQEVDINQKIQLDSLKSKLDLILTDLDNLKTQNQIITERLKNIEKTLAEMKGIRYY